MSTPPPDPDEALDAAEDDPSADTPTAPSTPSAGADGGAGVAPPAQDRSAR